MINKLTIWLVISIFAGLNCSNAATASQRHGTIVTAHLMSEALKENRTGLNPLREISIYLPPGYAESNKRYPVIYYFHSFYTDNEKIFSDGRLQHQFDRAINDGVIRDFILVAADYSSPTTGSFYENSSTSGHWLDFTTQELLPFIDNHYRTIARRESRALSGEFIGGYGALKFAMLYPELFSVVYALHPVGTGNGIVPGYTHPDWRKIHGAKTFDDLKGDSYSQVFVTMSQAYLPNPDRPPFYCDFIVEIVNGEPQLQVDKSMLLKSRFGLDYMLADKADNLRKMNGIKFDWGRYDPNQDHVYANQAFTRKLDELGIEHYAEEYRGNPWDNVWTDDGRVYEEMLPFFNRRLSFTVPDKP